MPTRMRSASVVVLAAVLAVACSTGSVISLDGIGPGGGSYVAGDGPLHGTSLVIPMNALAASTTLYVSEGDAAGALPDGATVSGPVVRFGPQGLVFATPVTMTLPATASANAVYTRPDGGAWSLVPGAVHDASSATITVQVSHFTEFVAATIALDGGPLETDAGSSDAGAGALDTGPTAVCGDSACGPSETCTSCPADCGTCTCTGPEILCSGVCVDLTSDAHNCGTCGAACPAGQTCSLGVCS